MTTISLYDYEAAIGELRHRTKQNKYLKCFNDATAFLQHQKNIYLSYCLGHTTRAIPQLPAIA